jgi:deoxyadenosine/deoxycytidine kinase
LNERIDRRGRPFDCEQNHDEQAYVEKYYYQNVLRVVFRITRFALTRDIKKTSAAFGAKESKMPISALGAR